MSKDKNSQSEEELINRIEHEIGLIVSSALDKRIDSVIDKTERILNGKMANYSDSVAQSVKGEVVKAVVDYLAKLGVIVPNTAPTVILDDSNIMKIMDANRELSSHTEDFITEQFKKIDERFKKESKTALLKQIEIYERFLNVLNYYKERKTDFETEYERFNNYKKFLEKELAKENVTFNSFQLGKKIDDTGEGEGDLKYVEIVNSNQCDDKEKWNTIKMLKDSNYYEIDGTVIRKQRVIIFGEYDC